MYANHDLHYANHHHRDFCYYVLISYYVLINVKEIFFWYIPFVVARIEYDKGGTGRIGQLNHIFEFQSWVKVVGEASEKCRTNLMYIYHKQCQNMQQIQ